MELPATKLLEKLYTEREMLTGIPTGFRDLDPRSDQTAHERIRQINQAILLGGAERQQRADILEFGRLAQASHRRAFLDANARMGESLGDAADMAFETGSDEVNSQLAAVARVHEAAWAPGRFLANGL